jgi:uncharacterized protein (TIGR01777 family)
MRILVTGASGLIGSAAVESFRNSGHEVIRLVRSAPAGAGSAAWDPAKGTIDKDALEGLDAVVHLAGENIAAARWTEEQKARIKDSRVKGTQLLSETLAGLSKPPKTFVAASATGFYGNRGDEQLDEASGSGTNFLAEVCIPWEKATEPAAQAGIRVVNLRIGIVLAAEGGALAKMLTPFKFGLGGRIGSGRQYMSWIEISDVVGAINHALSVESLSGPVNAVAPNPVTNVEFTTTLGKVLSRPTFFTMPAFAAHMAFGEMGDELLLGSTRVYPKRLLESDYKFRYSELEPALEHILGSRSGNRAQAAGR